MIPSSTSLRTLARGCAHALDFMERGVSGDDHVFAAGVAAHAVLDAVHREINAGHGMRQQIAERIAASVLAKLALEGRTHNGRPQPPLPLERARAGVEVALRYLSMTDYTLPEGARAEIGLAVDGDWEPCDYRDPKALYRGIIDVCGVYEEEGGHIVAYVRDYKSAWTTGPDAPDTLQMRGYVLLLLAHLPVLFPDVEVVDWVRREVVNLRSGATFEATDDLNGYALQDLDLWRAEIGALARTMKRTKAPRPANPGLACMGCLYRRVCEVADPAAKNAADTARRYATFRAHADQLELALRELTDDEPLEVSGRLLGWQQATRAEPHHEAMFRLWELVTGTAPAGAQRTLLRALGSMTGLKAGVVLALPGPDRDDERDALIAELTVRKPTARWGFHEPPAAHAAPDGPPPLALTHPGDDPPDGPVTPWTAPEPDAKPEPLVITPDLADHLF